MIKLSLKFNEVRISFSLVSSAGLPSGFLAVF